MKLVARKRFTFGSKTRNAGDRFSAPPPIGRALCAVGKAMLAPKIEQAKPPAPPRTRARRDMTAEGESPATTAQPTPRRTYRRRDSQAEV